MKSLIQQFDPLLENRVRLAIMSVLVANDSIDFNALKQVLDLSDGNLASHVATLERNHYVSVRKRFVGRKPLTSYSATILGRRAFAAHIDALERFIKGGHHHDSTHKVLIRTS